MQFQYLYVKIEENYKLTIFKTAKIAPLSSFQREKTIQKIIEKNSYYLMSGARNVACTK